MARRKGELTILMEVASKWPWKISAVLVPVSFVVCHLMAAAFAHTAAPTDLAGFGPAVIRQGVHASATLLQYVFPAIFLVAAVVSFVGRARSKALLDGVRGNPTANIASLSWQDFEILVGEGFRYRGFQVVDRGGPAPDGGIDLVMTRGRERFLVQCKQWRARQVGVAVVRELYGVMAAEQVAGGYVVTSGTFTRDAEEFASGRNIELIDGKGLDGLLRDRRAAVPKPKADVARVKSVGMEAELKKVEAPVCPRCKSPMVMRTAKNGSNVGGSFWGCAQYPKCRQTMVMG